MNEPCTAPGSGREVAAVIPARGGSKGIPRKNIADLGGLPLIAWSIRAALASRAIGRVLVSTDDEEIADTARAFGAEVPVLRPRELATDKAVIGPAIEHLLSHLLQAEGYRPDFVATLYPTSPFRSPETLDFLVEQGLSGHNPVFTAKRIPVAPRTFFACGPDSRLIPVADDNRRSAGPAAPYLRNYGYFYLENRVPYPCRTPYVHVLESEPECVDIDTPADLETAQLIVQANLTPKGWRP